MLRNACWTLAPRRHLSNNVSLIDCFFFQLGRCACLGHNTLGPVFLSFVWIDLRIMMGYDNYFIIRSFFLLFSGSVWGSCRFLLDLCHF